MTAEFWQYDARIGRRWNLDPNPNISICLYATFENNTVLLSDRLGDTTYRYKPDGKLLRITDFDRKGNVGLIYRTEVTKKGMTYYSNPLNFKFADPENDPNDIDDQKITNVLLVNHSDIFHNLNEAGVYEKENQENKYRYISNESGGSVSDKSKMDFRVSAKVSYNNPGGPALDILRANTLYITSTKTGYVAHNKGNFGNFLWGAGARALGFSEKMAKFLANTNNVLEHGFELDSKDDQFSIHLGFEWPVVKK